MTYRAPVSDMLFIMNHVAGMKNGLQDGIYPDLDDGVAEATLREAARLAENALAPLNRAGDLNGAKWKDRSVITTLGWTGAYRQFCEGGWPSLTAKVENGGAGLPHILLAGCLDMWSAANMAFTLCPVLTFGAIDALEAHASDYIKTTYLTKMITGEWTATMNLTEPSAGSDLNAIRAKAERAADGGYRIFGQKIFITYGEHDMTQNIVHLVLARLPDAPAGTRGISLFVVPKVLVNEDGSLGQRNDVICAGIEHKLGIHGSPTCTMVFGDNGGAVGYLVGEENRGLACMFTMMNNARLATGLQGVSMGEAAFQKALQYANERKQGKAAGYKGEGMSPIAAHPDVKRSLLTMKALTMAARSICYLTAGATDRSHRMMEPAAKKYQADRAALLTPIAKAFSSDLGVEVASLGVQIHGGIGFVEETGAAQFLRDSRIVPIYEGTNGIQAIDLVTRKLLLSGGETMKLEIADMAGVVAALRTTNSAVFAQMAVRLGAALEAFERATEYLAKTLAVAPQDVLASATPYLRLFGIVRGGTCLATLALAAAKELGSGDKDDLQSGRIAVARFFAENIATAADGLATTVIECASSVNDGDVALSA